MRYRAPDVTNLCKKSGAPLPYHASLKYVDMTPAPSESHHRLVSAFLSHTITFWPCELPTGAYLRSPKKSWRRSWGSFHVEDMQIHLRGGTATRSVDTLYLQQLRLISSTAFKTAYGCAPLRISIPRHTIFLSKYPKTSVDSNTTGL